MPKLTDKQALPTMLHAVPTSPLPAGPRVIKCLLTLIYYPAIIQVLWSVLGLGFSEVF